MTQKITVNGVSYDSVAAMPPDVRQRYEKALASIPELAGRDGDGLPEIVKHPGLSVRAGTTVNQRFVVNGVEYQDLASMPADARQVYDQAMQAMKAGGSNVKKTEIKIGFQVSGPGFSFSAGSGAPTMSPLFGVTDAATSARQSLRALREQNEARTTASQGIVQSPGARPIEPGSAGSGIFRFAVILALCMTVGMVVWILTHAR